MKTQITQQQIDRVAEQAHATRLETKPRVTTEALSEPWTGLSTAAKEYECGSVRAIITALEANGFEVRTREATREAGG